MLQNSQEDVKHSTGNAVNNTAVTMFSARRALEIPGEHFVKSVAV